MTDAGFGPCFPRETVPGRFVTDELCADDLQSHREPEVGIDGFVGYSMPPRPNSSSLAFNRTEIRYVRILVSTPYISIHNVLMEKHKRDWQALAHNVLKVMYMTITTYAAAAVLPWSVPQSTKPPIGSEADLGPLNLSYITRSWFCRFQATGPM